MADSPIINVTVTSGGGSGGTPVPVSTYVVIGAVAVGVLFIGLLASRGFKKK